MCLFGMRLFYETEESGRNFDLPPNCLKEFRWRACSWSRVSPEGLAKNMGWKWWEKLCRAWRSESSLCPAVSSGSSKHLFIKHLLFHLHVHCLPPPLWSQITTPTSSFVFSWRWFLRRRFWPLQRILVFLGLSHLYNWLHFSLTFFCSSVLHQFNS